MYLSSSWPNISKFPAFQFGQFIILTLFNNDPFQFWDFQNLTLSNSDTFQWRYFQITILSNSDAFQLWHFPNLTLSYYDTFQFWDFPILTLSNSDTFQVWHFPSLTLSKSDTFQFGHFPIRTLSKSGTFQFCHFPILTLTKSTLSKSDTFLFPFQILTLFNFFPKAKYTILTLPNPPEMTHFKKTEVKWDLEIISISNASIIMYFHSDIRSLPCPTESLTVWDSQHPWTDAFELERNGQKIFNSSVGFVTRHAFEIE